ncbi:peptidoglycan D,D-transpeptidase FtsI family protein [Secundilactobacillus paracollinoides]|uniref:peptidoglycan D,D-transpeptidase FtsI family protein n=1 Tax=Secundilactobacillus paracollinoides TaxID=240427 RepID=UPI0006F03C3C|nr:cell division protein FtsI [Secundilactobacillus paracollinoides DSM 15502 = JCM 11969]
MKNFFNRITRKQSHRTGSTSSQIPFRMNFLFVIVALLFMALIAQLAYLQILHGSQLKAEVNSTDNTVETSNVQRGEIFDSTGRVLVGNKSHQAISYTKGVDVLSGDLYKIANRLSKYITVSKSSLTYRNEADYYVADTSRLAQIEKKLPKSQQNSTDESDYAVTYYMNHSSQYKLTAQQKNAAVIYARMSGAYSLSTTYIKETGVTNKEIAEVGEHLSDMPGVKVSTSWTRDYPEGSSLKSIIGTVSSEKTGLPSDKVNQFLAEGYSRNDSVGQSYLEEQYESALKGTKSQTNVEVSGTKIMKEVKKYGGNKGDNLQLTINDSFQKKLQALVKSAESSAGGDSTGTYAVVMNPNTGAVIGMAGEDRNPSTDKLTENALGTMTSAITMGSVVKGAMVSGALMDGVITPSNNTLEEMPIRVGGVKKSSWFNSSGSADMELTAPLALEVSSNSYMMQLAMKEAGFHYYSGAPLTMSTSIFAKLRGYFYQFGLGVKTGIDIPGETTGIEGASTKAHIGNALDEAYGNYDGYTVMQLAQYISTIANGGRRIQTHLLQSIRGTSKSGGLGAIKAEVTPNVLNTIDMTAAQKAVVKQGLYDVVHGTNTYKTGGALDTIKPAISAKTGTAQTFYKGTATETLSLVSHAPVSHPKVVVALAMPNLSTSDESNNMTLAKQIYKAYWSTVQSTSTLSSSSSSN